MSNKMIKPLTLVIGAAFVGSVSLSQMVHANTAFKLNPLLSGYMLAAGDAKMAEGKCGEGKCGAAKMDANKDGKITRAEAKAAGWNDAQFDKADVNKHGYLTQADLDAYHKSFTKGKEGSCGADKKGGGKA